MRPTRGDRYDLSTPSVTKSVAARQDAAAGIAVWTPASGKRVVVTGFQLQVIVTATLQNAAVGDYVVLYDNAATAPISVLGSCLVALPLKGSVLSAGTQVVTSPGTFAPAVGTAAQGNSLVPPAVNLFYRSSAKDNVIKVALCVAGTGAVVDVGTGEILVAGTIWGHEEDY